VDVIIKCLAPPSTLLTGSTSCCTPQDHVAQYATANLESQAGVVSGDCAALDQAKDIGGGSVKDPEPVHSATSGSPPSRVELNHIQSDSEATAAAAAATATREVTVKVLLGQVGDITGRQAVTSDSAASASGSTSASAIQPMDSDDDPSISCCARPSSRKLEGDRPRARRGRFRLALFRRSGQEGGEDSSQIENKGNDAILVCSNGSAIVANTFSANASTSFVFDSAQSAGYEGFSGEAAAVDLFCNTMNTRHISCEEGSGDKLESDTDSTMQTSCGTTQAKKPQQSTLQYFQGAKPPRRDPAATHAATAQFPPQVATTSRTESKPCFQCCCYCRQRFRVQ
jgi:hypothetical protein